MIGRKFLLTCLILSSLVACKEEPEVMRSSEINVKVVGADYFYGNITTKFSNGGLNKVSIFNNDFGRFKNLNLTKIGEEWSVGSYTLDNFSSAEFLYDPDQFVNGIVITELALNIEQYQAGVSSLSDENGVGNTTGNLTLEGYALINSSDSLNQFDTVPIAVSHCVFSNAATNFTGE